jgi:hypothetical protein
MNLGWGKSPRVCNKILDTPPVFCNVRFLDENETFTHGLKYIYRTLSNQNSFVYALRDSIYFYFNYCKGLVF